MTNPTADYGFKVSLDSSLVQSIEKINITTTQTSVASALKETLLSSEKANPKKLGMDLKVIATDTPVKPQDSPVKPQTSVSKTAGIIKKGPSTGSKRKLTFKVDEKNKICEDIYNYPFPADADHNEVWWMDDELDQLLTSAMMVADHYTRKRKDWQNKIKGLMKTVLGCSKKSESGTPPPRLKASDLDFVVDSDARGLELYIHPIFQKNREKAVKGVVKVQEDYNAAEKKKGKPDPELRVKVLRAQSLKLTNLARLMAKTMADGDRRAATKAQEEGFDDEEEAIPEKLDIRLARPVAITEKDRVKTSELEIGSLHGTSSPETNKVARRPRARSPMRGPMRGTIIPIKAQNSGGLDKLRDALDDVEG